MNKTYFGNDYSSGTPIPKAMWWYIQEIKYKDVVNADFCNKLFNNEMKEFFEKYPEELTKSYPITKEDIEFYKKELRINE